MVHRMAILLSLLAASTLRAGADSPPAQPTPLAFTHATIIDATGAPPATDMTLVIAADRIAEIGKTGQVPVAAGAQVVDATGKFLIPGLWDMHIHWFGLDKTYLRLFLANGVTGARIMWGAPIHFTWRKEVEERALLAPRFSIASTIVDGPKPVWAGSLAVANESEGRQAVRTIKDQGADFVKVYSLLPRAAYFAIADESKKQGLPFAGHVPESVSALEASDAGQATIEHLTGILPACSAREDDVRQARADAFANLPKGRTTPDPARLRASTRMTLDTFSPEKAAALFTRLAHNHTWQCPTFTVLRAFANLDDKDFIRDPRLKYLPASMTKQWDPSRDFRLKERTPEDFDLARRVYKKQLELVRLMRQAGVPFLAGTDVMNPYCFPGFSLHDELALLADAGLTPMQALQAATLNPARFLGKDKDLGTLQKGKIADLVLLDANPLDDIHNTQRVNAVVANGRLLDRPALDKFLTEIEAMSKKN
jgi:imidazolonepropionase-like amidohydrolase